MIKYNDTLAQNVNSFNCKWSMISIWVIHSQVYNCTQFLEDLIHQKICGSDQPPLVVQNTMPLQVTKSFEKKRMSQYARIRNTYLISAISFDDSSAETIITNLATILAHILGDYVSVVCMWNRGEWELSSRKEKKMRFSKYFLLLKIVFYYIVNFHFFSFTVATSSLLLWRRYLKSVSYTHLRAHET